MRNISCTFKVDGVPNKVVLRKVAKERRFQASLNGSTTPTEYIISDVTNEVEYYDGPMLSDTYFARVVWIIKQYFPNVRAIMKVGADSYDDYEEE
ncbi:hypothetical protein SAMN05444266_107359 [Chitinophaga jiangningensis]|uniref:Uncharacterized protein n=1 Tax=Chitinophaga jiangningensis TaxID=1419482 RepID=A0A1M7HSV2_9BACT|nr:hypothetical protein [Chitinophaga jiangningensis]SHM31479.1 hypothetical protein SAMN05444266_107359 [Chitinophaga jiangningensis]